MTGQSNIMDLPITVPQLMAWHQGRPAQDAFPDCTPAQREFIISGMTEDDWDQLFGDEEEED